MSLGILDNEEVTLLAVLSIPTVLSLHPQSSLPLRISISVYYLHACLYYRLHQSSGLILWADLSQPCTVSNEPINNALTLVLGCRATWKLILASKRTVPASHMAQLHHPTLHNEPFLYVTTIPCSGIYSVINSNRGKTNCVRMSWMCRILVNY